jgi:coenzyme F420-dependent glucose-6-phosphate dehydrogenase
MKSKGVTASLQNVVMRHPRPALGGGQYWPEAPERINRMFEAIDIITKLFVNSPAGKDTKHSRQFYKLECTRLRTMSKEAPEILIATPAP